MFFRHDYSTPGPGIEKDAPEKTGVSRFVEILQLECVTLFQLNLLFLLTCLPVVTIPLALYAMNQVVRRMVLDQPVLLLHHYTTALRRGWGRAYLAFSSPPCPWAAPFGGLGSTWGTPQKTRSFLSLSCSAPPFFWLLPWPPAASTAFWGQAWRSGRRSAWLCCWASAGPCVPL